MVGSYVSLLIFTLPTTIKGPKFGFVVPKKVIAKAVERNKVERRIREVLRIHLASLPARIALVVQVKKEAADSTMDLLRRDIEKLLEQAHSRDTMRV